MIFSRIKTGLNLLATSVRYLIANPMFFLLPLVMMLFLIVMIAIMILLLVLGLPLETFSAPGLNYAMLPFYGLLLFSAMFLHLYVIHRLMLPFTGYQSSLVRGNVARKHTILILALFAITSVISAMPLLFLHGVWTVLYVLMLEALYLLSWPAILLVLQARYSLAEVMLRAIKIAHKMFPEVLPGMIIFHMLNLGARCGGDGIIISIIMSYFSALLIILEAVFALAAYRYYLNNKNVAVDMRYVGYFGDENYQG